MSRTDPEEESLAGGNASAGVVRIGSTVRKPWHPTSEQVVEYMQALHDRGIDLPMPRGRDDDGRLVLDYIPGRVAMELEPLEEPLLRRIGALVRSIHDASSGLPVLNDWQVAIPTDHPDLLCHNDLASWNLVIEGDRLVFIDWDGAGPSTRAWDLAYAAISFGRLFAGEEAGAAATRLKAFVDGYDADDEVRADLPEVMARRAQAMHTLLRHSHDVGDEPWASMYVQGHGTHWDSAARFIADHHEVWRHALGT